MKKKDFKQSVRSQVKDQIIKLRDTRGNFSMGIKLPTKDYKPNPDADPKERKRRYKREYYQRREVIARRKTPENKARKALYDRDRLRNRKNRRNS